MNIDEDIDIMQRIIEGNCVDCNIPRKEWHAMSERHIPIRRWPRRDAYATWTPSHKRFDLTNVCRECAIVRVLKEDYEPIR